VSVNHAERYDSMLLSQEGFDRFFGNYAPHQKYSDKRHTADEACKQAMVVMDVIVLKEGGAGGPYWWEGEG
jgi:hypothetical protein